MTVNLNSLLVFLNALIFVYSEYVETNCYLGEIAEKINQRFLEEHNKYRNMHGVPPLKLDYALMRSATKWSNELAKQGKIEPSPSTTEGENILGLFYTGHVDESILHPVEGWYKGKAKYNGYFSPESGHFSQIVWKHTEKLGCGVCANTNLTIVTCKYVPPGNVLIEQQFKENVLPAVEPSEYPMGPSEYPRGPSEYPRGPSEYPKGPSEYPRGPSEYPMGPSEGSMRPAEGPMRPAEGPMRPAEGPMRPAEGSMTDRAGSKSHSPC